MSKQSNLLPLVLSTISLALSFTTLWTAPFLYADPATTVRKNDVQGCPIARTRVGEDTQASPVPQDANANMAVEAAGSPVLPISSTSSVRKPILIFHAGPMKTGSTTIQLYLRHAKQAPSLAEDNFAMIGDGSHIFKPMCFVSECTEEEFEAFDRRMEELRLEDRNIIMSSEVFADIASKNETIKRSFDRMAENWDLRVVLVYRPFYDWLPSLYAQAFKARLYNTVRGVFRNSNWFWKPSIMDPFSDWAEENFLCHLRDANGTDPLFPKCQDSLTAFLKFKDLLQGRGRLVVVNLYQDGQLTENFLKASAPEAKNSIEHARSKYFREQNGSGLFELYYHADEIVMEAYRRRIVTKETGRTLIRTAVKNRLRRFDIDLPRACLNEEQKNLAWVHTKRSHEVTNGELNPTSYDELMANFQKAASTKLCGIDTDRVLEDPEWVAFIKESAANISASSSG